MLHNPSHPIVEPSTPDDHSAVSRMFADWCTRQGAKVRIEDEDDFRYVTAELIGPDGGVDRHVMALFDAFTGRFAYDGSVATECEFGSATSMLELARALRTGHRRGGHRS